MEGYFDGDRERWKTGAHFTPPKRFLPFKPLSHRATAGNKRRAAAHSGSTKAAQALVRRLGR